MSEPKVTLTLTIQQAATVNWALDLYIRLCIGQIEELASLVHDASIPQFRQASERRAHATIDQVEEVRRYCDMIKQTLGYPVNGSFGIGHRHVTKPAHRAYEIRKVLELALAMHHNPDPMFRGVNYDGLVVRYTDDPAPIAEVTTSSQT